MSTKSFSCDWNFLFPLWLLLPESMFLFSLFMLCLPLTFAWYSWSLGEFYPLLAFPFFDSWSDKGGDFSFSGFFFLTIILDLLSHSSSDSVWEDAPEHKSMTSSFFSSWFFPFTIWLSFSVCDFSLSFVFVWLLSSDSYLSSCFCFLFSNVIYSDGSIISFSFASLFSIDDWNLFIDICEYLSLNSEL